MQAFVLNSTGGPSSLKLKEVEEPKIKKNEVLVKNKAIGVNFFDICFRRGQYEISEKPAILGLEACGVIEKVGSIAATDFRVGDRVAYATSGLGAYAEKKAVSMHDLIVVPDSLTDIQVAGVLHKGLMVHTLLHRVYTAKRAHTILVTAAAGGVGHLLCQWAKYLGIEVIGTVGTNKKLAFARNSGCDHVIDISKQNVVQEVARITKNGGVGAVYDGVGKDTLLQSLQCLRPMGMCVSYGEASGNIDPLDLNYLVLNSLYLTRPTLALYKANRAELTLSANEVFAAVEKNVLTPQIKTYPFKDLPKVHKLLENRGTAGSQVLTFK